MKPTPSSVLDALVAAAKPVVIRRRITALREEADHLEQLFPASVHQRPRIIKKRKAVPVRNKQLAPIVLELLPQNGPIKVTQLLAMLEARHYQFHSPDDESAKKQVVYATLARLARTGKVNRVDIGVYRRV